MSFKLTWTTPTGSERVEVATAAEALALYSEHFATSVNFTVRDDHGRSVKAPDDLIRLKAMAEKK